MGVDYDYDYEHEHDEDNDNDDQQGISAVGDSRPRSE
jgi:hypothetical protein